MNSLVFRSLVVVGALAASFAIAGCADATGSDAGGPKPVRTAPAPSGPSNDPALQAEAESIEPLLRTTFARTYAGLELDQATRRLIIYRVPDAALDAAVTARRPAVEVVFRDARYPLIQLTELVGRVLGDRTDWAARGVEITGAAPKVDGSGVVVMTVTGSRRDQDALAQRYGAERITVSAQTITPVPGRSSSR